MAHEICGTDAVALAKAVRQKEVSPVEVVEAHLQRIDRLEPLIHSFSHTTHELARREARTLEQRILRGEDVGPLAGVPIGVKDLICTAGIPTASGSIAYKDFIPDEDDVVVERVKQAGAIIVGKTNVPEFGYSGVGHNPVFETTRNPWNIDLTPGGSSAGSGSAVASGQVPFAIGSDGGGSVRIPAAHSGIYGIKASMGRVPLYPGCRDERYPGVSSWETLEHIGPISRTVADSALLLSVMSGPDARDRHSLPRADFNWLDCLQGDLKGLRVAYSRNWGYAAVDRQVQSVVDEAVKVFVNELGCHVEEADPGWTDPFASFWGIVAADTDLKGMREMVAKHGANMSPHLVDFLNHPWTAEELTNAMVVRKTVVNKMWRFMAKYDLLLTPTLAVPPFPIHCQGPEKIDGRIVAPTQWLAFTYPINLTGQPAASVPAGFTKDNLPVGLQIVGRHLDDPLVLKASAAFEKAKPWRDRWPPLLKSAGLAH
ncbi:aspartyl-tRNA(Asn)/glutamyl-tRNA(Gln) amidotransferase subunit A [Bradyrhizobium elkanii]|uniref:amidase n=1 Tax=Bradyrhizobium TaxID=374 RepID=UPI002711E31A|nr:amidase family protein [Bradyrhizobium elkanii]WLA38868.1 amidase family protein [Bradyrhizobium elkanii]